MQPFNQLPSARVYAVDVLRGLTILLMVFVNEVAGVRNIPAAIQHVKRGVDGMTIVDWVFAGFLFVVGMSVPLALNQRILKGDTFWQLQKHIALRVIALLVLGVLMVNAESHYQGQPLFIPLALWTLLIYPFAILVWNVYKSEDQRKVLLMKGIGVAGLLTLAFIYRTGGEEAGGFIRPRWWGILGLIGWAYLAGSLIYQLVRGNKYGLFGGIAVCTALYALNKAGLVTEGSTAAWWLRTLASHSTSTALVLSGMLLTILFFDQTQPASLKRRVLEVLIFTAILLVAGMLLRPYYALAKLGATPTWGMYSASFAIIAFLVIYWIVDVQGYQGWTRFFAPAAANPLLTYLIPFVFWALYSLFDFYPLPDAWKTEIAGVLYCLAYAVFVAWLAGRLNKAGIKLQL